MPSGRRVERENPRHCAVVGCSTKHGFKWIHDQKVYSRFCPDHTCNAKEPFVDVFCNQARDPDMKYCAGHMTMACRTPGCSTLANNPRDVPRPWFCNAHTCDVSSCFKQKAFPHNFCGPHLIEIQRQHQRMRPIPNPPPRPMPKCRVDDCRRPQTRESLWCAEHTCHLPRCHNETYDDDEHRCIEHMPCLERNCDGFCVKTRDGEDVKKFCRTHIFCANRGCNNDRDEAGAYCKHHTCRIAGCMRGSDRETNRQFCVLHTCTVRACVQPVANSDSADSRICAEHKCAEPTCLERAGAEGGCCARHACAKADCFQRRRETFCREHECMERGCHAAASVPGGYCLGEGSHNHACVHPACRNRRANDPASPRLCREHLNDALRRQGEHEAERRVADELERLRLERDRAENGRRHEANARRQEAQRRERAEERLRAEIEEEERREREKQEREAMRERIREEERARAREAARAAEQARRFRANW